MSKEADEILKGATFQKGTPRSAILFGPPGTSKTDLARKIADFLGWPLLVIDPSLLLRKGMDGIQAEANTLFRMLQETEGIVVLFDEFDELVRERGSSDSQPFSRLLTTAMLPKLTSIHRQGSLVFIIATNHISEFDLAIKRRGRFDRVVQVMPPTYESKMDKRCITFPRCITYPGQGNRVRLFRPALLREDWRNADRKGRAAPDHAALFDR